MNQRHIPIFAKPSLLHTSIIWINFKQVTEYGELATWELIFIDVLYVAIGQIILWRGALPALLDSHPLALETYHYKLK
jgi:hypothetical protein